MNKFVLLDHSLRDLGGHYYTYASCVLPAAERAGFSPALATNRDFTDFDALPRTWDAHAIFRQKSLSQRTLDTAGSGGWWSRVRGRWLARERARIAASFAADCATMFGRIAVSPGDHVFLATASELDLHGLATFLHGHPEYRGVHFHLQFHLGIFHGREPDYTGQSASRDAMRRTFAEALARIPQHSVHLYCTTEQLTGQYQRLDVATFRTLPYPVHPVFSVPPEPRAQGAPARVACLGHTRREKGYRQLPEVVRTLWDEYLKTGRAQLLLQTRRRDLRRPLDAVVAGLGPHSVTPPVAYAEFPLPLERYAALVRGTDVGLLLYDSTRYYARCSGVLLEMLSAGVPVVVPAGGWLAEQIAEENQRYLERLAQTARVAQQIDQGEIACDGGATHRDYAVPTGSSSLLLRLRWREPASPGIYARIAIEQFDSAGKALAASAEIEGPRATREPIHVLFHLASAAATVRLTLSNAWSTGRIVFDHSQWLFLSGARAPRGVVGLTADDADASAALVHEVLQDLDHYRRGAAAFAATCARHHDGDGVVAALTARKDGSDSLRALPTGSG